MSINRTILVGNLGRYALAAEKKAGEQRELSPAQASREAPFDRANGARAAGRANGGISLAAQHAQKSHWPEGTLNLINLLSPDDRLKFDRLRAALRVHRLDLGLELTVRGALRFLVKAPGGWLRHFDDGLAGVSAYLAQVQTQKKAGRK